MAKVHWHFTNARPEHHPSSFMNKQFRLPESVLGLLVCPACKSLLDNADSQFTCSNAQCRRTFPTVDGIPVLINEENSVFTIDEFTQRRDTYFDTSRSKGIRDRVSALLPVVDANIRGEGNFRKFAELLLAATSHPRVLVIGGGIVGAGMSDALNNKSIEFVETDITFGERTALICDAHDIPFSDGAFDGVIAQAVLEHVVDPYRCVGEIYRVLKERGVVYAETPFMQQVHGGRYDFTRFTHLGHRRLFRWFDEIESGAVCGPGMALGWAYQYFFLSFTSSKSLRRIIYLFARLTGFFWKYFDHLLINTSGTLDAASGLFFIGRKSSKPLPDRELIAGYKGAL
jgi:uncharacterized protein YbaR (Trm112 family)